MSGAIFSYQHTNVNCEDVNLGKILGGGEVQKTTNLFGRIRGKITMIILGICKIQPSLKMTAAPIGLPVLITRCYLPKPGSAIG
jgi:hypothetical protein